MTLEQRTKLVLLIVESNGMAVDPQRAEEVARIVTSNVAALNTAFAPEALEAPQAEFVRILKAGSS